MSPAESLLVRCSYYSEKAYRRHRDFNWVLFLAERSDGSRHSFEVACRAPDGPSADEVLAGLVHDVRFDLAEIGDVARLGVGYVAHITTKITPIDPPLPEITTTRRAAVIVEAHSHDEHLKATREIIKDHGTLAALGEIEPANDSVYARLLDAETAPV